MTIPMLTYGEEKSADILRLAEMAGSVCGRHCEERITHDRLNDPSSINQKKGKEIKGIQLSCVRDMKRGRERERKGGRDKDRSF